MTRRMLIILTAAVFAFGAASVGGAEQKITASLKAYPSDYSGKCPTTISFRGKISVEGQPQFSPAIPVTIKYIFIRSDNAVDTNIKTISVPIGGSVGVSTTWTLGDPVQLPVFAGWEAVKILSPEEVVSEKAPFRIKCTKKVPLQHPDTMKMR